MKKKFSLLPSEVLLLLFVVMASFFLKWWLTHEYHFVFWFDQARDSIIAQEMIANGDFKVQGPSASGTQDTIYHGVIWFYFLAPLYAFFQGDPQGVVSVIAFLSSLAVIPYYFLVKGLTRSSKIAGIAALLITFSPDSVTNSTWIANPVMAYGVFPLFYLSVWKAFFEKKQWWLVGVALTFGVLQQSIIFLSYLGVVVIASYVYVWQKGKRHPFSSQTHAVSALVYLLTISTMIITQLKLLLSGIPPVLGGSHVDVIEKNSFLFVSSILNLYFEKMKWSLLPQFPALSVAVFLLALFLTLKEWKKEKQFFVLLWLLAPLSLLLLHYREAIHIILGVEWVLMMCLAVAIGKLAKQRVFTIFFICLGVLLAAGQIKAVQLMRKTEVSFVGTQQEAWMDQQLRVVDTTYQLAQGKPFSISVFSNPYGYNTTWAYLYDWYGKTKYGYTPIFFGPDQTGLFGAKLLDRSTQPQSLHFLIIEPVAGVPEPIRTGFMLEQNAATSTPSAKLEFGSIELQVRQAKRK